MHSRLEMYRHYQQPPQDQQQKQEQEQQPPSPQQVLITIWAPVLEMETETDQERIAVEIDNETLKFKVFLRSVYLHAAIFIISATMTWLVVSWTEFELEEVIPLPVAWWFVGALVFRMTMTYIPELRSISYVNWTMTICILLFSILIGASFVRLFPALLVLGNLLGSIAIVAILYAIGALCPRRMLPGLISLTIVSCICLVINIVLFVMNYFVNSSKVGLICGISILCWVVVALPFDAQEIHDRVDTVSLPDVQHCALTIFIHFTLTPAAICLFYLYHKYN